jgi:hypothetical protein
MIPVDSFICWFSPTSVVLNNPEKKVNYWFKLNYQICSNVVPLKYGPIHQLSPFLSGPATYTSPIKMFLYSQSVALLFGLVLLPLNVQSLLITTVLWDHSVCYQKMKDSFCIREQFFSISLSQYICKQPGFHLTP